MKIQTRQSLYSSIAFGVIFIILSSLIYLLYSQNAKRAIYKNLETTAHIVALFHLEEDELNAKEFEKVKKQFNEIVFGTTYQVYNQEGNIIWGDQNNRINASLLIEIEKNRHLRFTTSQEVCYAIFYEDNQGDFIIVTKEPNNVLTTQLVTLLWILIAALIIGLVGVIFLSRWLASIAYKPFRKIIEQVQNISPNNPSNLIQSPHTGDELQELTETFNQLLERISETLVIQKNFVNYVSHEFKTPLASILGNLEVFSLKDRTPKEYEELSIKLIAQIHQLESILETLIVISDLRKGTDFSSNQFRIDELIWEIIQRLSLNYANCKIDMQIDILPEDENLLLIQKDRTQVLMALFNIIENAVKYSKGEIINIKLYNTENKLSLSIHDRGIGIRSEDLEHISKPFYRANNAALIHGTGVGLSIALRILEKNDIKYEIHSKESEGTCVKMYF